MKDQEKKRDEQAAQRKGFRKSSVRTLLSKIFLRFDR